MFRIWCEYDYGQDSYVFLTPESAKDWFNTVFATVEWNNWLEFEETESPFAALYRQGLLDIQELRVL